MAPVRGSSLNTGRNIPSSFDECSKEVHDLDAQLGEFTKDVRQLGRASGVLSAVKQLRLHLSLAAFLLLENAKRLQPKLTDPKLLARISNNPRASQESRRLTVKDLPAQLDKCSVAFAELGDRLAEFPRLTDEGDKLGLIVAALVQDFKYRASCLKAHSPLFDTPEVQYYILQVTGQMGKNLDKFSLDLADFASIGIPAIQHEHKRETENLMNISTVATFFSAVTATTLQMSSPSTATTTTAFVVNTFWFASLVFSIGAALNSFLARSWKQTTCASRGRQIPAMMVAWIDNSPIIFLAISIVTFLVGLVLYSYSSNQPRYTSILTFVATAITTFGLAIFVIWILHERFMPTDPSENRRENDLIHSDGHDNATDSAVHDNTTDSAVHDNATDSAVHDNATDSAVHDSGSTCSAKRKHRPFIDVLRALLFPIADECTAIIRPELEDGKLPVAFVPEMNAGPIQQISFVDSRCNIQAEQSGVIQDIAFSPDHRFLAITSSQGRDAVACIYDVEDDYRAVHTTSYEGVSTHEVQWSPSGEQLLVHLQNRAEVLIISGDRALKTRVDPAGHILASRHDGRHTSKLAWWGNNSDLMLVREGRVQKCDNRGTIKQLYPGFLGLHIHDATGKDQLIVAGQMISSPEGFSHDVNFSTPEGQIIACNPHDLAFSRKVPLLDDVWDLLLSPDGVDLIVGLGEKAPQLWKAANLKFQFNFQCTADAVFDGPPQFIGEQLVSCVTTAGEIYVWRRCTGALVQKINFQEDIGGDLRCISGMEVDGKPIVAIAGPSVVKVFELDVPAPVETASRKTSSGSAQPQTEQRHLRISNDTLFENPD